MFINRFVVNKRFSSLACLAMTVSVSSLLSCSALSSAETTAAISPPDSPGTESVPPTSTADSRASEPAIVADTSRGQEDTVEPVTLEMTTLRGLNDAQGSPYGDVRERLLERGWIPHTFATTNGQPSNYVNNSVVQQMENLGFEEIKDCSGTGQGFCLFEFVYQDRTADFGPVLQVTTAATAQSANHYPEPIFWDYSLSERSNLTYLERSFDPALFVQLRDDESFCLGVGRCEPGQYMLKDGLLIAGSGDFGSTKMSLIPTTPVSKDTALDYAKILDADGVIDFAKAHVEGELNLEQYFEPVPATEGWAALDVGSVTMATLRLTPNGMVSEISFSINIL